MHFHKTILQEKVKRKTFNINRIKERINFLDEANMTKFVLNYLKVYEPGKYFYKQKFGKHARKKKAGQIAELKVVEELDRRMHMRIFQATIN